MVKEWKVGYVKELSEKLKKAKTLGIADVGRLPSRQMQVIRKEVREHNDFFKAKKSLLLLALEKAGLKDIAEHMPRSPVVIIGDEDAFSMFRKINKLKSPSKAKPGMVAEEDIIIKKGGTGLPPGPAIGDLQAVGIPAKIKKGQIEVIKDFPLVKSGEEITPKVAKALNTLGMKPFNLGLKITAIKEGDMIFKREVLDVDLETIISQLGRASSHAFSLAYDINYPIKEILEMRFGEAGRAARALALDINWVSDDTVGGILSKANSHALSLKNKVGGG